MEHAIRHAITVKMKDNPVLYQSLLERLQRILEETNMNWGRTAGRQLEEFVEREMQHGEEDLALKLGFSEKTSIGHFILR